jgi:hypothetical protein
MDGAAVPAVALFVKKLHDGSVFPGQRGALYTVRAENSTAAATRRSSDFCKR